MGTKMQIQTERLIIRNYQQTDLEDIHEYGSDPEVVKYVPFGPNTYEDSQNFLNRAINKQKEKPRIDYGGAVVLKSEDKLIGGCRITKVSENEGNLGYALNRHYWGKEYATEAAKATVEFGFKKLGVYRIYADCHPDNVRSIRVLEKVGMTLEGTRREYRIMHGEYSDMLLFSILEHEWRARKF